MAEEGLYALQDAWLLAMQREQDAFDFYTRMAHSAPDPSLNALFTELAEEETRHKARLVREYRRVFEADLELERGPVGTFESHLHEPGRGPIAWMEWTEDSFRLAQELDLPILLDISAVWCHWCHVMDHFTYADPEIASLINAEFIPIRVDNDRRPDVNARYNMGGWPTTAILTPTGEVLTGRAYIPPDEMVRFLKQGSEYYRTNREELEARLHGTEERRKEAGSKSHAAGPLAPQIMDDVAESVLGSFDRVHGGFGEAPKFPHPDALEVALVIYHRTGDNQMRRVVELTLTNMATGGMYDHEMGGFFRYSTTQDWTVPHYEKMAEDNARLIRLYLHAYQVLGKDLFRQCAEKTLDYVTNSLYDQARGFFYGSQDADESYYHLAWEERLKTEAPYVDKTAYTNWNAMMAMAFMEAAVVLSEPAYTRQAMRALDFIWQRCHEDGMGMFHYHEGVPHVPGLLTDQVWTARALLEGYQFSGRPDYLHKAMILMNESVYLHYADPDGPGHFDCVIDPTASGRLKEGIKNIDENALVGEVSMMLYRLTGEDKYRTAADQALSAFGAGYAGYRYSAAGYALAVDRALRPYIHLIVAGNTDDARTGLLLRSALAMYIPNRLVQVIDPTWERGELERMGFVPTEVPVIHICQGEVCAPPVTDPDQVSAAVAALSALA